MKNFEVSGIFSFSLEKLYPSLNLKTQKQPHQFIFEP